MLLSIYNYFCGQQGGGAGAAAGAAATHARRYSTNNPPMAPTHADSFHPRLKSIFLQLDSIAPRFVLRSGDISILQSPDQFYLLLKAKIATAQHRVFLSSLYVGKAQTELVECLDAALAANEHLHVSILTDALRGTREAPDQPCSALLLVPLVTKFGKHRVDIRMYHTPHLAGFTKSIAPKRLNETYGLQHMKLYGFDDEIILSGANLSQDYFTDRQDRYYVFANKPLTDYYHLIHAAVSSLSYQVLGSAQLKQGFRLSWPTSNKLCEPHMNLHRFLLDSSYLLNPLLKQHSLAPFEEYADTDAFDTIVYPVSQFTPLFPPNNDNSTEKPAVLRLLSYLDLAEIKWWFTAGYFNMLTEIQERLINGKAEGTVITASPKANSFYQSLGISYYVPAAYLLMAKKFLEEVFRAGKASLISVYEWQNGVVNTPGGWSYHAKGLWISVPNDDTPSITVIGSSNYTKRAYSLDLESNAIVITKDEGLKLQMKAEIDNLMKHARPLELSDFQPKAKHSLVPDAAAINSVVVENNDADDAAKTVYEIDEDKRISLGVRLAVKLLGGKL